MSRAPAAYMGDDDARAYAQEIEAFYRLSRIRRLSNSESCELADLCTTLALRAERENTVRVPEFMGRRYYPPRYYA